MANRRLSYPASDIDDRLGTAHTHTNLDQLELIDESALNSIQDVANKANLDLLNVTPETLAAAVERAGVAFIDAPQDSQIYARTNGQWVNIQDAIVPVTIESTTLDISKADNIANINLPSDIVEQLQSIVGKSDKLSEFVANNVLIANDLGDMKDSGVALSQVVRTTELVDDPAVNDADAAPSTALTNRLYTMINSLVSGAAQTRGSVYHALSAAGTQNVYTISSSSAITIVDGGTGYTEGMVVGYSGVIDATFLISAVDDSPGADNTVTELTLVNGGMFDTQIPDTQELSLYGGGVGASGLTIKVTTESTARTTLYDIESPIENDTAYVMQDETHSYAKSLWIYTQVSNEGTLGWVWIMSFPVNSTFITRITDSSTPEPPVTLGVVADEQGDMTVTGKTVTPNIDNSGNLTFEGISSATVDSDGNLTFIE